MIMSCKAQVSCKVQVIGRSNFAVVGSRFIPLDVIPEGYRMLTAEDKEKPKPEGYKVLTDVHCEFKDGFAVGSRNWDPQAFYIVPEVSSIAMRKEIEAEIKEAQTKLDNAQAKLKALK